MLELSLIYLIIGLYISRKEHYGFEYITASILWPLQFVEVEYNYTTKKYKFRVRL